MSEPNVYNPAIKMPHPGALYAVARVFHVCCAKCNRVGERVAWQPADAVALLTQQGCWECGPNGWVCPDCSNPGLPALRLTTE